jgi:hypothetical protein
MDEVGNFTSTVTSHAVFIDQPIPPLPAISIVPGSDPDAAIVSWDGYDSDICGFSEFWVFVEQTPFASVVGLTAAAVLDSAGREYLLDALDRSLTYYIAVVGVNSAGEYTDTAAAASWSDPYAGPISGDIVIGGGDQKEIEIFSSMVVTNDATLTIEPGTTLFFAPGTGITIDQGRLQAAGSALYPIVLTSDAVPAGTAAAGDWLGVSIGGGDAGSVLQHVFIEYGQGLQIDAATLEADDFTAFTARHNSGAGLLVRNNGSLTTSEALLRYNDIGGALETNGSLTISDSVIKNNGTNASSDGSQTMAAQANWWGAVDEADVSSSVTADVDYTGFLIYEPVLTPAIGTANGATQFSIRDVPVILAARNGEEMRLSEDSTFTDVFFDVFASTNTFTLSPIGGEKTVFAQFKSPTGTASAPVSVTLLYVADGPTIDDFGLAEGQVIHRPLEVSAGASAVLGMQGLEFYVDDVLVHSEPSGTMTYLWDMRSLSTGIHRVKLLAYDNGSNLSAVERNVVVEPLPPPAPQITEPTDGVILNSGPIIVRGGAEAGAEVKLTRNGFVTGTVPAGPNGLFELADVALAEGDNVLIATSQDLVGISANSNIVTVVLDSGPPEAPVLENADSQAGVGVSVMWKAAVEGETPSYYRVYRSQVVFSDPATATLIADNVTNLGFTDDQVPDGVHFYGVTAVDVAGNESTVSNLLSASYDGTPPAFAVNYDRPVPVGTGILGITVNASEALLSVPSLTIRPAGANTPAAITLIQQDALTFEGSFEILSGTATGPAAVSVSGTDLAGNSFSGSPSGLDLVIDTDGPRGTVTVGLPEPIQIMDPVNLDVSLNLTEAAKTGTQPLLQFIPPVGDAVTVALIGSDEDWNGILPLEPAMESGIGTFTLLVFDELGNESNAISTGKSLEVYNTLLPDATAPPTALGATSLPGGVIQLSWTTVAKADSYKLYRRSGTCAAEPDALVTDGLLVTIYQDTPPSDGTYCYAVSTDRRGAESAKSVRAQADSDRLPPDAPENVGAALGSVGVRVSWDSPAAGEVPQRYFVYRNGSKIRTVPAGAAGSFEVTDYPAAGGSYDYVVASVDSIGNENPSAAVTFDLAVGAVTNLQAVVNNDDAPLLTWNSSDPGTVGYNVYRGGIKLNSALIALGDSSFEDTLYAGSSRVQYGVTAVNGSGDESPLRTVDVYPVALLAIANPDADGIPRPLVTRYFNNFEVTIANNEAAAALLLDELQVRMSVNGEQTFSRDLSLDQTVDAGASHVENIAVPLGAAIEDRLVKISVVQPDAGGSQAVYRRDVVFSDVVNSSSMVTMNIDQVPLAGGYSRVNVCVQNHGYLDRAAYTGIPPGTRFLGRTRYVSIAPGDSLCVEIQILVPESLAEGSVITFIGGVGQYTYDLGGEALGATGQLIGTMPSGITLSEYYGTAQADKDSYAGDETVTITGQAIDRESGLPQLNTALKIGFNLRGFTWYEDVTTDENGDYTHEYQPSRGVSGEFIVWAAHPDVYDIIDQDRFSFYRVYVTPLEASIRSSKAATLDFEISLINPGDMPLTGFALEFRAYTVDGGGGEVSESGLQGQAIFPDGFQVDPGETQRVQLKLSADADAPDEANVEYRFVSAEGASAVFYGSVTLVEAVPVLTMEQPAVGYVEASVDRGTLATVPVTVKNVGLIDLLDAEMTLPQSLPWISTNLPDQGRRVEDL